MFDNLWGNVEEDIKKWATGKSSTENRIETLQELID